MPRIVKVFGGSPADEEAVLRFLEEKGFDHEDCVLVFVPFVPGTFEQDHSLSEQLLEELRRTLPPRIAELVKIIDKQGGEHTLASRRMRGENFPNIDELIQRLPSVLEASHPVDELMELLESAEAGKLEEPRVHQHVDTATFLEDRSRRDQHRARWSALAPHSSRSRAPRRATHVHLRY